MKNGTLVTPAPGTVYTNFGFLTFCFQGSRTRSPCGKDGRTDGRGRPVMRRGGLCSDGFNTAEDGRSGSHEWSVGRSGDRWSS